MDINQLGKVVNNAHIELKSDDHNHNTLAISLIVMPVFDLFLCIHGCSIYLFAFFLPPLTPVCETSTQLNIRCSFVVV